MAEIGVDEVGMAEVGSAQAGFAQVGVDEVGSPEDGSAQVRPLFLVLRSPCVPCRASLLEQVKVFLVRHSVSAYLLCELSTLLKRLYSILLRSGIVGILETRGGRAKRKGCGNKWFLLLRCCYINDVF